MSGKKIVCIGAALLDETFVCAENPLQGTSNPALFYRSPGGVTCNVATHLSRLGHQVEFISQFGNDSEGEWLASQCRAAGIGITHSLFNDSETGRYVALLGPTGDLFAGAASGHFEDDLTPDFLENHQSILRSASLIQFDCNLNELTLQWILSFCREHEIPTVIEPVSVRKAARLSGADIGGVLMITPNKDEMAAFAGISAPEIDKLRNGILERGVKYLWIRDGENGSDIYRNGYHYKLQAPRIKVIDATGAGDAALAGWIHGWMLEKELEDCVKYGHALASIILREKGAVSENLSSQVLENIFQNYV